jgi:hypothetical protein
VSKREQESRDVEFEKKRKGDRFFLFSFFSSISSFLLSPAAPPPSGSGPASA